MFGPAWVPPVSDGSGQDRKLLRSAGDLLNAAGWTVKDGKRVNAKGEQLSIEFLLTERSFEPHHTTFIKNLRVLGIDANIRLVDPSQAEARIKDFDFDIAIARFIYPQIPGSALRNYFSSEFAKTKGSNNLAGVADPVVDALVEKAIAAQSQARAQYRVPGARSRAALRPVLDSALEQGVTLDRLLGPVRLPQGQAALCARRAGDVVVRGQQGSQDRTGEIAMSAYIARRILLMLPTLLGILFVSFVVVQFAPGGPVERVIAQLSGADTGASSRISGSSGGDFGARNQVGASADMTNSKYRGAQGLDPDFIKSLEKQFGFDKPAPERFLLMVWNFARFDFGKSYFRDVSVLQLIKEKLPVSMSLGIWMTLLTYLISIPLGIRKAVQDGSKFDTWTSAVIIVGFAIPGFLFAILLIILFAGGSFFNIFPLRGLTSDGWAQFPWYWKILDYFWHIALPLFSMALGAFATMTLLTKNSFLDEIRKQYVMTARAKGCSERQVLYNHIFRNAMLIVIAGFPGAFIHAFFSGSLLIETIFSLDGLGLLGFESVLNRDYPVVFGTLFIFSLVGLVINLVSDLAYMWIDPRIDFEAREV